jgi:hypothetical protein
VRTARSARGLFRAASLLAPVANGQDGTLALVPAASYRQGVPVAPASIVSAFGQRLATSAAAAACAGPVIVKNG